MKRECLNSCSVYEKIHHEQYVSKSSSAASRLLSLLLDAQTIAATESIATSFTSRIEPLYGLGTLCPSLTSYLESSSAPQDAKARSFALALKLVGGFFESLPAEVLEDIFPQSKDLIKKVSCRHLESLFRRNEADSTEICSQALNDQSSGDLRRAAINALVSAQSVLRDEKKLTEMIDGLEPDQVRLKNFATSQVVTH